MGDHQMRMYFDGTDQPGGMICEEEGSTDKEVFKKMKDIHQKSFEDVNGTFVKREGEKICAIPLAHTAFFKVLLMLKLVVVPREESRSYYWRPELDV